MKIYDLTHPLTNHIPVYPGTSQPSFLPSNTIQKDGFRETHLNFDSHTGTHIDAPAHMLENGKTLNEFHVGHFTGKALIITVTENSKFIEKNLLLPFQQEISLTDFVLFKTGWSKHWGKPEYFNNYPTLVPEVTDWLMNFPLKGIGFDTISADYEKSGDYPNHLKIFKKNSIIIENLVFPRDLSEKTGIFFCLPLPVENADGSTVRAVLLV